MPNQYDLLATPAVQTFIQALALERSVVFVTGCARSGTSLLHRCLATVREPWFYWSENRLAALYLSPPGEADNVVLKRRSGCHKYFDLVPPAVKIVHIVRDPAYVLTSQVRQKPGYYVSPERWLSEYRGFRLLQDRHPSENLIVVRYEDLISDPDELQSRIRARLGLTFDLPFSRYQDRSYLDEKIDKFTGVKRQWDPIEPERASRHRPSGLDAAHLVEVYEAIGGELTAFCAEFGYPRGAPK